MTWIILAFAAQFFWAVSNIFDKYALGKLSRSVSDFIFFGTIGNTLIALILLATRGIEIIPLHLMLFALLGGAFINYGYIFYAKALEKSDSSRVVPLFQTIPIFILILGTLFFQEFIAGQQLVGFFIVFVGGILLSINKDIAGKRKLGSGFWLMLTSSFLISVSILFSDTVLEQTSFITLFTYDVIGFSLAGFSLLLYTPWRKNIASGLKRARTKKYSLFLLNDVIDVSGHICYKFALIGAPSAALVAVMGGSQPFFLLILGTLVTIFAPKIITEDISKKAITQKLIGVIIIFIGVALITLI